VTLQFVKAFFAEIRKGDADAVRARLDTDPSLIAARAKAPPKKDDGQSPLQVAIKSAQFEIAELLLERGADVNFIETSAVNQWNAPVLHDSIRAAVFSSRFGRNRALPGEPPRIEVVNTKADSDRAFALLQRLLATGADVSKTDSFGNPPLQRAILDARQVARPLSPDLAEDLHRIFSALLDAGADPHWQDPRSGQSLTDQVEGTSLRALLP
jgi:ankyrin repeat protein